MTTAGMLLITAALSQAPMASVQQAQPYLMQQSICRDAANVSYMLKGDANTKIAVVRWATCSLVIIHEGLPKSVILVPVGVLDAICEMRQNNNYDTADNHVIACDPLYQ